MKRIQYIYLLILCVSGILRSSPQADPNLYAKTNQDQMNHWVDSVFDSMNYDERIGQLFMVIADPKSDTRNMQKLLRYINEIKIGGVLFYKGNPVTQAEVTNRMQKASKVPLFVALDGEWGLSMRLTGTTRFPKNMMLGAIENDSLIRAYGEEMARQCREMGIQINFAPSIDVNSNTENPVIGLRSFGENPQAVADKGIAYAHGLENGGVIAVAKHFPGHGDTAEDSHYTLPVLHHSRERLEKVELVPFKRYIYEGFAGVMTAHLSIPALDNTKGRASSLSPKVVNGLLKKHLGFRGLCFTDALAMKGASANKRDNPSVLALLAGNDILLAPADPIADFNAVKEALDENILDIQVIEEKCLKILRYKYITGLNRYSPINLDGLEERLNSPHAAWITTRLNADAITLLKNDTDVVPLKQLDKRRIAVLSIGNDTGNPFQEMLNRYDSVACFSIGFRSSAAYVQDVYKQLLRYDVIICSVHTVRIPESEALRKLAATKTFVYSFFTIPYFCKSYAKSIASAQAVIMAYESTPLAQAYAAQLIFGGIPAKGKLPVSIPDLYWAGSGLFTEKTRLGYHEAEEVGLNPTRLAVIDKIVEEGLDAKAFPGCQVLVAKDGMIVYDKAFGTMDDLSGMPVTETTVYDIASMSKAAGTLLAVMKTYDEKKFSLTQKISDFVPELKSSDKKGIIIKDMLYHQSGLAPSINFYLKAIDPESYVGSLYSKYKNASHPVRFDALTYVRNDFSFYPSLVSDTKKDGFTIEVAKHFFLHDSFRDSIMQGIIDSKLSSRGKYVYSCVNFILLKMMTEKITGVPMGTYLDTNFYKKLGARYTHYNPLHWIDTMRIAPTEKDDFIRKQLLRGYVHDEAAAFQGGVSGNAGLFSTAEDVAKVSQMLLNKGAYGGERYLSEETCRLFTRSKSPNSRRGLGFDKPHVGNARLSPCGALAPSSVYGHTGFTGTCFWIDPDNQLIYVFLSNRVYPNRANNKLGELDLRTRIQDAIYKAIDVSIQKD